MAGVKDLPLNRFRIGGAIPQLQGTPLTSLPISQPTQPSVPFSRETLEAGKQLGQTFPVQLGKTILEASGAPFEAVSFPVEKGAEKIFGKESIIPSIAGLGTTLAVPGPGGKTKAVSKADDVVAKLINVVKASLKEAKPLRREIEVAMTAERAKRFTAAEKAGVEAGRGEKGFIAELGKLEGELVPDKPTQMKIRGIFSEGEIDTLFNKVDDFAAFNFTEKLSTKEGLATLLKGEIPQPAQISKLEDVFGSDLVRAMLSGEGKKIGTIIKEAFNIPRAFITSLDASAVFRQGAVLTARHPVKALGQILPEALKDMFSPKAYRTWFDDLPKDPMYRIFKDFGGFLSDADKIANITAKEERYISRFAERIPILGKLIKASERAYTSYLNKLRFDSFKQVAGTWIEKGKLNPNVDKKAFEDLADMVNIFTGRGNLGRFNRIAEELNVAFFSPRLVAARFQALNPTWYAKQHPAVRKEAVRSFAQFVGSILTIAGLASLNDEVHVELDPRSSDFMKIRVGDTRWDLAAGFQQFVRLFAQLAFAQRKSLSTGEITDLIGLQVLPKPEFKGAKETGFPFESQAEVALRFLRGKTAPIPGLLLDLAFGANVVGEEPELKKEALENVIPFYIQDIKEAYNEFGQDAFFSVGIPAFFGVGVQTFEEKKKGKRGVNRLP